MAQTASCAASPTPWKGRIREASRFSRRGLDSGAELFELWTVVARASQFFLVRTQTLAEHWPEVGLSVNAFADSFTLEAPMPFGASREDSLFQYWGEIVSIDPALARSSPADIVGALFSGLVKLDTNLEVVPDVAEGWEVSEGGTVFTFTLRSNALFHDGRPVTAADFKYSWERALDPATESSTAKTFLGDIVGASEMLEGLAQSVSGIEALDERTLRVTIDASRPAFLFKLAYPTAYVVDRANVEEGGADWTDAPNGTGAFKLKVWQKDELLVLERNDEWYGGVPALAHSVYRIYAGLPRSAVRARRDRPDGHRPLEHRPRPGPREPSQRAPARGDAVLHLVSGVQRHSSALRRPEGQAGHGAGDGGGQGD